MCDTVWKESAGKQILCWNCIYSYLGGQRVHRQWSACSVTWDNSVTAMLCIYGNNSVTAMLCIYGNNSVTAMLCNYGYNSVTAMLVSHELR